MGNSKRRRGGGWLLALVAAVFLVGVLFPSTALAEGTRDMYRLYNPNSGEHFYTSQTAERDSLVGVGWRYEGVGWVAPETSDTPVYRLYSGTDHHYTISADERDALVSVGWLYEGIGWYSAGTIPVYRQFNPNVDPTAPTNNSGSHNYTTSKAEDDALASAGWRSEGIGWYGVEGAQPAPSQPTEPAEPTPTTVYWVAGGEVWHLSRDCPSLHRSQNVYSGTVAQAQAAGKVRVCKNCS